MIAVVLAAWFLGGLVLALVIGAVLGIADARRELVVLAEDVVVPSSPAG